MSDGSHLEIRPHAARPVLRDRFPWLRRLRFYDSFYPAIRPLSVSALDLRGVVVARASLARGAFSAARAEIYCGSVSRHCAHNSAMEPVAEGNGPQSQSVALVLASIGITLCWGSR